MVLFIEMEKLINGMAMMLSYKYYEYFNIFIILYYILYILYIFTFIYGLENFGTNW